MADRLGCLGGAFRFAHVERRVVVRACRVW
jgi:hypothetical protein